MRIDRLHLLRYGPFEDRSVAFPECPLVVVLGQNEAGKTTTLRAITELLFGIGGEQGTTHRNFRFDNRELRLGAEISGAPGRLAFRRRKGNKNTLVSCDDEERPLGDDALAGFLGGADRALFAELFGLSQPSLRSGGKRLVDDQGRLGESLLSAGGALRDVAALARDLGERADALYTRRKSEKRAFYAALGAFDQARKALRSATLHLPRLRQAEREAAGAGRECEEARRRLIELDEAARLDARMIAALPVLRRLQALRERLVAEADLDGIDARRARALIEAEAAVRAAREGYDAARRARVQAARALDEVPPESAASEHAGVIDALCERRGKISGMRSDLPRVETKLKAMDEQLDRSARQLGLDRAGFDGLRPSALDLAEAGGAFQRLRALRAERVALEERIRSAEARIAKLKPKAIDGVDPVPLRRRAARLASAGELQAALERARAEAEAAGTAALRAREGLVPGLHESADLCALAVPGRAAVAAAEKQRQQLANARSRLAGDRAQLGERREKAEAALARLSEAGATASRDQLEDSRAARDGAWREIRSVRLEGAAGDAPEPGEYEALVRQADGLADLRESSADIRAQRAEQQEVLDGIGRSEEELACHARTLDEEEAGMDRAWSALWTGLAGPPAPPAEMRDWLDQLAEAQRLHEQAGLCRREVETAARVLEESLAAWRAIADDLGIPSSEGADTLAEAVEERLSAAESAAEARAQLEVERRGAAEERERRARSDGLVTEAAEVLASALGCLGLDRSRIDEAIETGLRIWAEVPGLREQRRSLAERIAKMREEIAAFDAEVAALDAGIAIDTGDPDATLRRLESAVAQDRQSKVLRTDRTRALTDAKGAEDGAGESLAEAEAELAALLEGLPDQHRAEPGALAERLERREALRAELEEEASRLVEQGWPGEQPLLDALDGAGEDALRARQEARRTELEDARRTHEQKVTELAEADRVLKEMAGDAGADAARWQLRSAAVRMQDAADEWARLRAASLLLAQAVRRYRDENRDPLVTRAAEVFRRLTGGAFEDLVIELGDDDEERLFARRSGGESVPVSGLSESTADQLFLALRIAAIERHCASAGPLPFVGDDLLASFDRPRTAAGLDVLAELGGRTQTLLFTHHHAVAEAAGQLGSRAAIVEL